MARDYNELREAAARKSAAARDRALNSIASLKSSGKPLTLETVSEHSGLSKRFLSKQEQIAKQLTTKPGQTRVGGSLTTASHGEPGVEEASLIELRLKLDLLTEKYRDLTKENRALRAEISVLLGHLADQASGR